MSWGGSYSYRHRTKLGGKWRRRALVKSLTATANFSKISRHLRVLYLDSGHLTG
jgi:hypothetical protein